MPVSIGQAFFAACPSSSVHISPCQHRVESTLRGLSGRSPVPRGAPSCLRGRPRYARRGLFGPPEKKTESRFDSPNTFLPKPPGPVNMVQAASHKSQKNRSVSSRIRPARIPVPGRIRIRPRCLAKVRFGASEEGALADAENSRARPGPPHNLIQSSAHQPPARRGGPGRRYTGPFGCD